MEIINEKRIGPDTIEITIKYQISKLEYLKRKQIAQDRLSQQEIRYQNSILPEQENLDKINIKLAKFDSIR